MDQPSETPARVGIKIERPPTERIGFFYFFLVIVSLLCIVFTAWLMVWEWMGRPLPQFLKLPIG